MPNKWTFKVKPIAELLNRYDVGKDWIDPFAGMYSPAEITNDADVGRNALYQYDGFEFLSKHLKDNSAIGALFDPPYSTEQCLRTYKSRYKGTAGRSEYVRQCKDEIARVVRPGGLCISFGWNSAGIGKGRGFKIEEILLVCHGGFHYDTIITIDRKVLHTQQPLSQAPKG